MMKMIITIVHDEDDIDDYNSLVTVTKNDNNNKIDCNELNEN